MKGSREIRNPLHLVERDLIARAVIELGGARALVRGQAGEIHTETRKTEQITERTLDAARHARSERFGIVAWFNAGRGIRSYQSCRLIGHTIPLTTMLAETAAETAGGLGAQRETFRRVEPGLASH